MHGTHPAGSRTPSWPQGLVILAVGIGLTAVLVRAGQDARAKAVRELARVEGRELRGDLPLAWDRCQGWSGTTRRSDPEALRGLRRRMLASSRRRFEGLVGRLVRLQRRIADGPNRIPPLAGIPIVVDEAEAALDLLGAWLAAEKDGPAGNQLDRCLTLLAELQGLVETVERRADTPRSG